MHNEREKGMRWKQFTKRLHYPQEFERLKAIPVPRIQRRDLRFIGSEAHPVCATRDDGDATAKRVFVKRRGTRPNPRKLYQEMPESVNPQRGGTVRCTQQIKFPPVHDVPVCSNIFLHFSAVLLYVTEKYQGVNIYQIFHNYFDRLIWIPLKVYISFCCNKILFCAIRCNSVWI